MFGQYDINIMALRVQLIKMFNFKLKTQNKINKIIFFFSAARTRMENYYITI